MTAVTSIGSARLQPGTSLSTFVALMKREFWEHRGALWSAQIWTTIILLILIVLSMLIGEAFRLKFFGGADVGSITHLVLDKVGPAELRRFQLAYEIGLWGLGMINQIVLYFVVLFYCIGTLYDERKDRSILFWKSLPATDTQTVLTKLLTALLVAPLLALVAIVVLQLGFVLLLALYTALHGVNPLPFLWQPGIFGRVWSQMLVAVPVHLLWALPGIAWLLLASSWAKRAPFVWAILVPVLFGVFYSMIQTAVRFRLPDNWVWENVVGRIFSSPGTMALRPWEWRGKNPFAENVSWQRLTDTLTGPETWIGVIIGVALVAAAIWLRRYRDDS
jgi:ABC-2 type transport system permease protein